MYKKKNKSKKIIVIILVTILLIIGLYFFAHRGSQITKIEKLFLDAGSLVERILSPKISVDYQKVNSGINRDLESKINELEKMLEMTEEGNFILEHCHVIHRYMDTWNQELVLDKGSKDGIKIDMAVVTSEGLIGRIHQVGNYSSKVKLVTDSTNQFKASVLVTSKDKNYYGVLNGYDADNQYLLVQDIPKSSNIEIGSIVVTSGLGGVFPAGVFIGKVTEITTDSLGISKVLKITSEVNYQQIRFVSVIKGGKE